VTDPGIRVRSRRARLTRREGRRLPEHLTDPFELGVREARAGVPKIGSYAWVESGRSPAEWFDYSRGYDGHTQRRAAA
jgi:hypothetical protein